MKIITPDWKKVTEAEFKLDLWSGDPDEWLVYEQNEKGYYPSFIRYGEFIVDTGKKVTIEVAENGFIMKRGQNIYICGDKYDMEKRLHELTHKLIEKERELTEAEIQELISFTLEVNTHFAAQSKK